MKPILLLIFTTFLCPFLYATSNIYCIGPSASYSHPSYAYVNAGSPYPTITAAIAALNANTFGSSVIFEIQNNYVSTSETFPINITFQGNSSLTAKIQPRDDAPSVIYISGSLATTGNVDGLIVFNGADYVSIDGSPGGTNGSTIRLGIRNTGTTAVSNIQLKNDAKNNTINAIISENANSGYGIYVNGSGTTGNDFLTISNCQLTVVAGKFSFNQVIVNGSGTGINANNDLVFTGNSIYNTVAGISLFGGISGSITITNNSFYSNLGLNQNYMSEPISVNTFAEITNVTITGNYIGGSAPLSGGTSLGWESVNPSLINISNAAIASTSLISSNVISNLTIRNQTNSVFTITAIRLTGPGTISNNIIGHDSNVNQSIRYISSNLIPSYANFTGISSSNSLAGTAVVISGNTIQNIAFETGAGSSAAFNGIFFNNGSSNGNSISISDNMIRNLTSNILGTLRGFDVAGPGNVNVSCNVLNNKIESITTTSLTNFTGIRVQMHPSTISGNRIGKFTTPNDISITSDLFMYGIRIIGGNGLILMENDTISNVTLNGNGNYYCMPVSLEGNSSYAHTFRKNIIQSINSASSIASTEFSIPEQMAIVGINFSLFGLSTQELRENSIIGLTATNTGVNNPGVVGIYSVGNGRIINNKIFNINNTAINTSPLPLIYGIRNSTQSSVVANNFISLSHSSTNALTIYGIYSGHTSGIHHYYFNSINISGNASTSIGKTYAIAFRNFAGTFINVKNNIFQNSRIGGEWNFAVGNIPGTAWAANSLDYNSYFTHNWPSMGEYGSGVDKSLSTWRTATNGDYNSISQFVTFVDPDFDLHVTSTSNCSLKAAGTPITSISNMNVDFDFDVRNSPPSIGADEIMYPCQISLNVKAYIQGFFNNSQMPPLLYQLGMTNDISICDSVFVELRYSFAPYPLYIGYGTFIHTDGTINLTVPISLLNNSVYIVLRHRNALETWSSDPVLFNSTSMSYDFSDAASKAYGSNQIQIATGIFGLYSGDVGLKDGFINMTDYTDLETGCQSFQSNYSANDLNGDLMVESADLSLIENNVANGIAVAKP